MSSEDPILQFSNHEAWKAWLDQNHAESSGVWVRMGRKSSTVPILLYAEALETALCYGWIDARKKRETDTSWLQRFTPRAKKSIWSKINRAKAVALIEAGAMHPAGLREVERAKADGRWDAAYDSHRTAVVPADLKMALDASPGAHTFFDTLNAANRYAILWRLQTTKTEVTRARKIVQFVEMLERHEKFHP